MTIGDKIPEILGIDQDGHEIKASDYRGRKIVLYSYPKANTSGCTAEACSLQAHKEELAAAGYEIIGVSKDKQALQKKFADAHGLQFPLIADTETTLLQQLGCWGEKVACGRHTIGILRTTYLVNEEGIIEKIFTPKEIKTKIHTPSRYLTLSMPPSSIVRRWRSVVVSVIVCLNGHGELAFVMTKSVAVAA